MSFCMSNKQYSSKNRISVLDTTLRDGAQGRGISFSIDDKLKIVSLLDELGVAFIEAGNPGSNPKDQLFFEKARKLKLKNAQLTAFGSTCRPGEAAMDSALLRSLVNCGTNWVTIFGKSSRYQVEAVLRTTPEENLRMIYDTVSFLVKCGLNVIFDAEHFFDGFMLDSEYSLKCLEAANDAGAAYLVLCDTNGGAMPDDVMEITLSCTEIFSDKIGIHCHNDSGLATACTLSSVKAGATHVQGTMNGIGERCGNTNLCTVLPALALKKGYTCLSGNMNRLAPTARAISDIANLSFDEHQPYVGRDSFAHKAGMHVNAVLKSTDTFDTVDPSAVGNERRLLLSEISGRSLLIEKLKTIAPDLNADSAAVNDLLSELKTMEMEGYQFDGAEDSFRLFVLRRLKRMPAFFEVKDFKVISDTGQISSALIKISVDGREEMTAAEGNGPVDALDRALRKALMVFYPCLIDLELDDFKVRVIETGQGTSAKVRVTMESTNGKVRWGTVGVSVNILDASWQALVDSIECQLMYTRGI